MAKTAVVEVARFFRHSRYTKGVRRTKRYPAQNTLGAKVGEPVVIEECRPISKEKRFRIVRRVADEVTK